LDTVTASGAMVPVRLLNAGGTIKVKVGEAITAGNSIYEGASGKGAASGDTALGTALEAATADRDIIEMLCA